jgi:hypothetical protein
VEIVSLFFTHTDEFHESPRADLQEPDKWRKYDVENSQWPCDHECVFERILYGDTFREEFTDEYLYKCEDCECQRKSDRIDSFCTEWNMEKEDELLDKSPKNILTNPSERETCTSNGELSC